MIVRPLHRTQLLIDVKLLPRLEHQHAQAVGGQDVGGHAAGRSGAHDHCVVRLRQVDVLLERRANLEQCHCGARQQCPPPAGASRVRPQRLTRRNTPYTGTPRSSSPVPIRALRGLASTALAPTSAATRKTGGGAPGGAGARTGGRAVSTLPPPPPTGGGGGGGGSPRRRYTNSPATVNPKKIQSPNAT